jgi:NAD(P)-dependent dehydrogenase (short-subunit alcohol dehydrogenase family)
MMQVIMITGASSGFGALAARALAHAGHTIYATMRETTGRNAPQVVEVERYAAEHGIDLRTVELDVASNENGPSAPISIRPRMARRSSTVSRTASGLKCSVASV